MFSIESTTTTVTPGFSCNGDTCTLTLDDGTKFIGTDHDGVVQFRGIPYAEAPVVSLRFKKTIPRFTYNGATIDATNYGSKCRSEYQDGSEDCLTVNINVARNVIETAATVPVRDFKPMNLI